MNQPVRRTIRKALRLTRPRCHLRMTTTTNRIKIATRQAAAPMMLRLPTQTAATATFLRRLLKHQQHPVPPTSVLNDPHRLPSASRRGFLSHTTRHLPPSFRTFLCASSWPNSALGPLPPRWLKSSVAQKYLLTTLSKSR
jgi:hypothetical protein